MENNRVILEKEIDLIQACINRMAQNSFMVKGWTITLIAVVLALLPENFDVTLLCSVGIIATLCFWYLDAFFLKTERLYRWKYDWVIARRLETTEYAYDLNPNNENMWLSVDGKKRNAPTVLRMMFTKTTTPIYVPLSVLSAVYLIFELTA